MTNQVFAVQDGKGNIIRVFDDPLEAASYKTTFSLDHVNDSFSVRTLDVLGSAGQALVYDGLKKLTTHERAALGLNPILPEP